MGKPPRRSHKQTESNSRRRPARLFPARDRANDNPAQPSRQQAGQTDHLVKLGIDAIHQQRFDDAVGHLASAVALNSNHALAHNCLGIARRALGNVREAIASYEQALRCQPDYAEAFNNLGVACESIGDDARAATAYEAALRCKPGFTAALNNFGNVLTKLGKPDEAVGYLRRALKEKPDFAAAHNNLGLALCRLKQTEEAEKCFRRTLALQPRFAEALVNLGNLLRSKRQHDEAAECYRRAVQVRPQYPSALVGLGNVFLDLRNLAEASAAFDAAINTHPQCAEAHFGKGNVALETESWIEAEAYFKRAIDCSANYAEALNNLGTTYRAREMLQEAEASYQAALRANPDLVAAHNNLGNLYRAQDRYDLAAQAYSEILRRRRELPLSKLRISTLCPAVFNSRTEMDDYFARALEEWTSLRDAFAYQDLSELYTVANEPPYNLQFFSGNIRPLKEAYAAIFRYSGPSFHGRPPGEKIRIGCVISRGHEVAFLRLIWETLRRMNREEFEVTVVCDASSVDKLRIALDDVQTPIVAMPAQPHHVLHAVRQEQFDVLYYFEICTDATNYFLPFFRLAPVQVTTWGIQVTSGISNVDYYLSSDLVEAPDAQDHYSERLVRAKTLLTYHKRLVAPENAKTRHEFGFSRDQHLYVCAQHLGKFHPDFDLLLAEVLRRDPRGVIVGTEDKHGTGASRLRQRWERNIPDVAGRIILLPRLSQQHYLALLAAGDVMLDPMHFGGVSTTYDCFSLGKPIVTLPSRMHRGRYTAGCYARMGITRGVARDAEDYVQIAVRLADNPDERHAAAREIRENDWKLFEDPESVTEHERIFRELVTKKPSA